VLVPPPVRSMRPSQRGRPPGFVRPQEPHGKNRPISGSRCPRSRPRQARDPCRSRTTTGATGDTRGRRSARTLSAHSDRPRGRRTRVQGWRTRDPARHRLGGSRAGSSRIVGRGCTRRRRGDGRCRHRSGGRSRHGSRRWRGSRRWGRSRRRGGGGRRSWRGRRRRGRGGSGTRSRRRSGNRRRSGRRSRLGRRRATRRQEAERIDIAVLVCRPPDAQMDVRARHLWVAGGTHCADDLAVSYACAPRDRQRAEMRQSHRVAVAREHGQDEPALRHGPGERDRPGRCGVHLLARGSPDVDATVLAACVGVGPEAERPHHGSTRGPRPSVSACREGKSAQNEGNDNHPTHNPTSSAGRALPRPHVTVFYFDNSTRRVTERSAVVKFGYSPEL
jgi:hypothetical protein